MTETTYFSMCRMLGENIEECPQRGKNGLTCGNCSQVVWMEREHENGSNPTEATQTNEEKMRETSK